MEQVDYTQLGAIAIIFLFFIKEFFGYMKAKKSNGNGDFNQAILDELRVMNSNHLHSIKTAISEGNEHLIETIHNDNTKIIELLAEIKGRLR